MSFPVKKIVSIGLYIILVIAVICLAIVVFIHSSTEGMIFSYSDVDKVPAKDVAIVFGASVNPDSMMPSDMLADRIITGVDLYKKGLVKKLVMSGDNRVSHYNEPLVMRKYAEDLGVPAGDIVLDYAGRRTYDTCYRAREIFGISNAILVTQKYHLYRALYTCRALGLSVVGVSAERQTYTGQNYYNLRELFATLGAFFDVNLLHPNINLP